MPKGIYFSTIVYVGLYRSISFPTTPPMLYVPVYENQYFYMMLYVAICLPTFVYVCLY